MSGNSETALQGQIDRYHNYLRDNDVLLADVCYTAGIGRNHFPHRVTITASDTADAIAQLAAPASVTDSPTYHHITSRRRPKTAFLFTGQGSQYVGMGRELYESSPTFRATIYRCNDLLQPHLGTSLLSILYPTSDDAPSIHQTTYTQPALFAIEYALATLWQSWGIKPNMLLGHSVGEFAAACVAGVFSLEDGLKLIAARARLMGALPQDGEMVSFLASEETVLAAIAPSLLLS